MADDDVLTIPVEADTTYEVEATITYRPLITEADLVAIGAYMNALVDAYLERARAMAPYFEAILEALRPLAAMLAEIEQARAEQRARLRRMHQQYRARRRR